MQILKNLPKIIIDSTANRSFIQDISKTDGLRVHVVFLLLSHM